MSPPDKFDPAPYIQAALLLHGLPLDAARRAEVEGQFRLLTDMMRALGSEPLAPDVEPAPIFRL